MTDTFAEFGALFAAATGFEPHPYQLRIADADRLPDLIEVPPGCGKTAAVVLPWLWRRVLHPADSVRRATPRRLVYALPQRALTDQVSAQIGVWLRNLDLEDAVDLYVVMGGTGAAARPWRENPERVSILVGTIDMITSKALVRAYGTPRNAFPMDAALVWNDAHLVVDEVQGAPATTVTLRQIDSFRRGLTAGPAGLTCMSATVPPELIDTVDNPYTDETFVIRLDEGDDTGNLAKRRAATRTIDELEVTAGRSNELAVAIMDRHRYGSLTLVILNTVKMACEVNAALAKLKPAASTMLLHSRFRPVDRAPMIEELFRPVPPAGRIVVSTQVVEAGIDVDAQILITEVAPWPSIIQRSGRCNRSGEHSDAQLWWVRPSKPAPYESADLDAAASVLTEFAGQAVTNERLLAVGLQPEPTRTLTLRRRDFMSLFDTAPDMSGNDLDVAPYIRDTDDLDVQLCWMEWDGTAPPDIVRPLGPDLRCRVPLGGARELIKRGVRLWRFDQLTGRWRGVDRQAPPRPGEILLVAARDGGYRRDTGFDAQATAAVPIDGATDRFDGLPDERVDEAFSDDAMSEGFAKWIPLDQHLVETHDEAVRLTAAVGLSQIESADVELAARIHDVGKAHPTWQDALCGTASSDESESVVAGRPWAKSATRARLQYPPGITRFRHELAGLLLLDGPLAHLLDDAHDPDLVRYLVLAHHGKLRMQVRDPERPSAGSLLGLVDGDVVAIPEVLDQPAAGLNTTVRQFDLGGDPDAGLRSWADVVAGLLRRYGPFRLAYLETLVRVADWRASALHDVERRA